MSCTLFVCVSRVEILGMEIEGEGWFVMILLLAFSLQVAANFIRLKNTQYSREILQLTAKDNKRTPLIHHFVGWTALSTTVWIIRVIFIMGNNLWIYLVILLGNVVGVYLASTRQAADVDNTIDMIVREFDKQSSDAYRLRKAIFSLPRTRY